MPSQKCKRSLAVDDVPADEELDLRAICDSVLGVEAADFGVLEGDVFIQADAVGLAALNASRGRGPILGFDFRKCIEILVCGKQCDILPPCESRENHVRQG